MTTVFRLVLASSLLAASVPGALAAPSGETLFTRKACVGCHVLKGHKEAKGSLGPDLSKVSKTWTREDLVAWIRDPQARKPDSAMPTLGLTQAEAEAIADYLLDENARKSSRR